MYMLSGLTFPISKFGCPFAKSITALSDTSYHCEKPKTQAGFTTA